MSDLRRERVVSDLNKALLPIIGDDSNFKEAAPLLFGMEFAEKGKELVDQVTVMKSTITKKQEWKPPSFRGGPPNNWGGFSRKYERGGAQNVRYSRERSYQMGKGPLQNNQKSRSCVSASHPKRNLQKYVGKSYCMSGCNPSDITPSASRKAVRSSKHLEGVDKRPMGVRHCKGLSDRLSFRTSSEGKTSHATQQNQLIVEEVLELLQRSNRRDSQPPERVPLKPLPGPKNGQQAETRDKPEGSEPICSHATLPDGWNPFFEGSDKSEGLVGKS